MYLFIFNFKFKWLSISEDADHLIDWDFFVYFYSCDYLTIDQATVVLRTRIGTRTTMSMLMVIFFKYHWILKQNYAIRLTLKKSDHFMNNCPKLFDQVSLTSLFHLLDYFNYWNRNMRWLIGNRVSKFPHSFYYIQWKKVNEFCVCVLWFSFHTSSLLIFVVTNIALFVFPQRMCSIKCNKLFFISLFLAFFFVPLYITFAYTVLNIVIWVFKW